MIDSSAREVIRNLENSGARDKLLKCHNCGRYYIPAIDTIAKRITGHVWKADCNCYGKGLRICIG